MAFTDAADMQDEEPSGGGGGGAPAPGGQAGPAPPGGGPILAALARRNLQPPVSTPGPGNIAQGLMMLKNAVDMIHQALPMLDPSSQQHKDVVKALSSLTKHLPQGAPTAGVQQTQLGDMLRNTGRNAVIQKIMQGQGGAQGGGQGAQGQPGLPTQPMPSTPLPGA